MKYIAAILIIFGLGYFFKEALITSPSKKNKIIQSANEKDLFETLLKAQPTDFIVVRPMNSEDTGGTLIIYAEYLGEKTSEARESARSFILATAKKWSENQAKKYDSILIKYTDEEMSPFQKQNE